VQLHICPSRQRSPLSGCSDTSTVQWPTLESVARENITSLLCQQLVLHAHQSNPGTFKSLAGCIRERATIRKPLAVSPTGKATATLSGNSCCTMLTVT